MDRELKAFDAMVAGKAEGGEYVIPFRASRSRTPRCDGRIHCPLSAWITGGAGGDHPR